MNRREPHCANREMAAAADSSLKFEGLVSTLGVGWPNGASAASGMRDSSYKVDIDSELMTSPPPPANVRTCTLPLLGRIQVC